MTTARIGRRTLLRGALRGAGGVALSLPWLEAMAGCSTKPAPPSSPRRRAAELDGLPTRFVVFYTANGTHPSQWFPTGTETSFTLGPYLAPLEAIQSDVVVLRGIDMPSGLSGAGDDHQRGLGAMLTGIETIDRDGPIGAGISLDQEIASHIGAATRLRSLELGVQTYYNGDTIYEHMSYLGSNQPVPVEEDPRRAFSRLFADFTAPSATPDPAIERARLEKQSVLDYVAGDYDRLRTRLGTSDRTRIEEHLAAIRDVESRLGGSAPIPTLSCSAPALGTVPDLRDPASFSEIGRLQMDLLAMALACDLTRVASLMWSQGRSKHVFTHLGISEEHHELSHATNPDSGSSPDAAATDKIRRINQYYASEFVYLVNKLRSLPEGDGTVLDHTLILWISDLGEGREHTHDSIPIVLAGGASGALRTGRFLDFAGASTNRLFVTILQMLGVAASSFGNPDHGTGPLARLV